MMSGTRFFEVRWRLCMCVLSACMVAGIGGAVWGINLDALTSCSSMGYRIHGAAGMAIDPGDADQCGISVSTAGDVNGDGFADVIVGAPGADYNGRNESGAACVLFGNRRDSRVSTWLR